MLRGFPTGDLKQKREEKRPFRTYKIGKVGQASMCDNPPLEARTSESLKVQNIRHGTTYHMVSELCVPALWYVLPVPLPQCPLPPTYLIFPLHITAELRDVTTFIFQTNMDPYFSIRKLCL